MVVNRVSTSATNVILFSGTGPIVLGSNKTRTHRWIPMAGITFTTFKNPVYMQGSVNEHCCIAVPGRLNISVTITCVTD